MEETVNRNEQLILNFAKETDLRIKNWELEDSVPWRDRSESAIYNILVNG